MKNRFAREMGLGALALSLCGQFSFGAAAEIPFRFKDETRIFLDDRDSKILISKECAVEKGEYRCSAYFAWKKGAWRDAKIETVGGASAAALLCRKVLRARVVIGRTKDGIENSFCLFPDRSMISCGAFR